MQDSLPELKCCLFPTAGRVVPGTAEIGSRYPQWTGHSHLVADRLCKLTRLQERDSPDDRDGSPRSGSDARLLTVFSDQLLAQCLGTAACSWGGLLSKRACGEDWQHSVHPLSHKVTQGQGRAVASIGDVRALSS